MSNILSSILETLKKMSSKKRIVPKQLQENLATYLDTKLILNFSFFVFRNNYLNHNFCQ